MNEGWSALGEVQYRVTPLFRMEWNGGGASSSAAGAAGAGGARAALMAPSGLMTHPLEDLMLAGARYGGCIATTPTPRKIQQPSQQQQQQPQPEPAVAITIYSASGVRMGLVQWEHGMRVAGLGWTDQECLVAVATTGLVFIYDLWGNLMRRIDPFEELQQQQVAAAMAAATAAGGSSVRGAATGAGGGSSMAAMQAAALQATAATIFTASTGGVAEVHVWGNGVVILTETQRLVVVQGLGAPDLASPAAEVRVFALETSPPGSPVPLFTPERPSSAMAIIPPALSRSGLLEVLLGTQDGSLVVVDENGPEDQRLTLPSKITRMAVAPNGRFLACFIQTGTVTVMSTAFTNKVLDFDTRTTSRPRQIAWCGEDCIVLYWKNMGMVLLGPYGDYVRLEYPNALVLVPEADSCRVLQTDVCELIQRVPAPTEAIFRIGSTDPAALLYDATLGFEDGEPNADDNIRSMEGSASLVDAIQACVAAALSEFEPAKQQQFLRAASYGKAFCPSFDPEELVRTCKKLRVLNSVRDPKVGLPLTAQQYLRLTPQALVHRLVKRNMHFLALKICDYLQLRKDLVLVHWACEKIRTASPAMRDEELRDLIHERLRTYGRVSYLEIANAADSANRRKLATMLLDLGASPIEQVPMLLAMQEDELAMQKATASGDSDLVQLVLLHLDRASRLAASGSSGAASSTSSATAAAAGSAAAAGVPSVSPARDRFLRLVLSNPEAAALLRAYYRGRIPTDGREDLDQLSAVANDWTESGMAAVQQALSCLEGDQRKEYLVVASHQFSRNRELQSHKAVVDEQLELLELQRIIEVRSGQRLVNRSLAETLHYLIVSTVDNPAEAGRANEQITQLCRKFRVSDKRLCFIKIRAFASAGQWARLAALANERRNPVGFKPFAKACLRFRQQPADVDQYIERITPPEDRFELFMQNRSFVKAADVAFKSHDQRRLMEVREACDDPELKRSILEQAQRM